MPHVAERVETKVQRWGNSQGVRIPREVCDGAGIRVGDTVVVTYGEGTVTLTVTHEKPRYRRAGHRSLAELCAGYDGPPAGEEWLAGRVGAEAVE